MTQVLLVAYEGARGKAWVSIPWEKWYENLVGGLQIERWGGPALVALTSHRVW